jgi:hypothetical protein
MAHNRSKYLNSHFGIFKILISQNIARKNAANCTDANLGESTSIDRENALGKGF